ncbi:chaperonin-containing T-complex delta subunit [Talaromyces pinophilus]|uniref:T-complex protein 1 subunit delta n=1 Tax=Talaromyces pinophilus TaxID=128442 RepID=A0A6V8HGJ9_TALPI|nr:chaperonin-containing T-complex delta subunit [Talaromyces pinophilus]
MASAVAAPSGAGNSAFKDKEKPMAVRNANILAARAVADAIRTSLGPRGMDKMIQSGKGNTIITNDGNTMLKSMSVMHPAAKMLVDLSAAQDIEAGDGTTSVVVIAGSLLGAADRLLSKGIHPTIISESFQRAAAAAVNILHDMSQPISLSDRTTLLQAASTSLSSKIVSQHSNLLGPMAVDSVLKVIDPKTADNVDLRDIRIIKKVGGTIEDSEMVEGLVLNQPVIKSGGGPTRIEKARIALIQFQLSPPKPDMENQIVVNDYRQMDKILKEERQYLLNMVKKIQKAKCNVLLIQKSILRDAVNDLSLHFLSRLKILAVKDIERDEVEFLCKSLGCKPIANIDSFTEDKLGTADIVEEVQASGARYVKVTGIKSSASTSQTVSIVARGANNLILDEAERSLHDALCVIRCLVKKRALIAGGGAPEIEVAHQLAVKARELSGTEAICWKAFADAMEVIPTTLAENAGLNSIKVVTELRHRHAQGEHNAGVSIRSGGVKDNITEEKVLQPLLVSTSAIELAAETVKMILRIDDIALSRGQTAFARLVSTKTMARKGKDSGPEFVPLTNRSHSSSASFSSTDSLSSDGSLFGEDDVDALPSQKMTRTQLPEEAPYRDIDEDVEVERGDNIFSHPIEKSKRNRGSRLIWVVGLLCLGGWILAFVLFWGRRNNNSELSSSIAAIHDADSATGATSYGKPLTLDGVLNGSWGRRRHSISWIAGPNGEDGLLLERGEDGKKGYLRVESILSRQNETNAGDSWVLMESGTIEANGKYLQPAETWPSPDFKTVLVAVDVVSNWRHSFTATYWLFDVDTQTAQPLDPDDPKGRIQLASWSPQSDAIVFTRDNNLYLRKLGSDTVSQLTKDGGKDVFNGVPDWVYEEEVFGTDSATWWSNDGKYVAFLRTNESMVPEFPIEYYMSRPSGKKPPAGLDKYPDVRKIKYPKAGSPNPVVALQFYDVESAEVFSVDVSGGFSDDDRLITEVVWASNGKVLVKEFNRESDVIRTVLIDVASRMGELIRVDNFAQDDGGWAEVTQSTTFIPADPANRRPDDGYIDIIVHEGYDHWGYFTPINNSVPILLTSGPWEVVDTEPAVDLINNIVYLVATKESPTQQHVYSVKLDGSDFQPLTDVSKTGYYDVSFSLGGGYALLSYEGPHVPWQKLINTPNDVTLQVVERRPPHFNPIKKYPVLFWLYGGPGSQSVDRRFSVDFQSYVASTLGYIVVTVDGRGTGHIGRAARTIVRGNLGYWEARDQIETAKAWAKKSYVDKDHIAIWGWSYGGFMTLKTLEQDAGQTFQYGMAVSPVTDWRFYDSIYTERYMHTPEHNPTGYEHSAISNMTALQQNVRFLVMHGTADDNVHFQNTLSLIDKLDVAGVENYDVHVYPDSDHSIYFHNAHKMVYDRLASWLVNAFTDEWHHVNSALPVT